MPIVDDISIRITDAKGESQRMHVYAPTGPAFGEIVAFTDVMLPLLDAITLGAITAATVTRAITLPGGLKGAAVANSDYNEGGNIRFDVAASNYNHSIRVPALVQTLFTGRDVNVADAAFVAWANSITNGLAPVLPSNKQGGDLLGVIDGKKTFHK